MGSKLSGARRRLTSTDKKFIIEQASKGTSRNSISVDLKMSNNIWKRRPELEELYQQGLDHLRNKIAKEAIDSGDYRDRAMLFNRLSILSEPIEVKPINSIEDLQKAMGEVLVSFANGKITSEQLNSFTKSCAQLSQLYFDQSIQVQLDELKADLANKQPLEQDFK